MKTRSDRMRQLLAQPVVERLEGRLFLSASVSQRFGDELVITATSANDTISITQSKTTLTITADGVKSTAAVPAAGVFVYTRGGSDAITIASSVNAQITIDSIDNAPTSITSYGSHVIAWTDATDHVIGTASVHAVASFAGGVSKALGASLPQPHDSGTTVKTNLSLFGTGPVAGDVNQGKVGDCYFLATLAGFAQERPQLIRNSAVDLGDGTYAVEFYSKGKPVFIRVNNVFATGSHNGFAFAHPGADHTIWAMVMEKAFAYFRTGANTYSSTADGWMADTYSDLNVSSMNFYPWMYSDAQLYNILTVDLQHTETVTLATDPSTADTVGNHAYTLIGVKKVNGANEYILRNPWGVSGALAENSSGIATLTYYQICENFSEGVVATN